MLHVHLQTVRMHCALYVLPIGNSMGPPCHWPLTLPMPLQDDEIASCKATVTEAERITQAMQAELKQSFTDCERHTQVPRCTCAHMPNYVTCVGVSIFRKCKGACVSCPIYACDSSSLKERGCACIPPSHVPVCCIGIKY